MDGTDLFFETFQAIGNKCLVFLERTSRDAVYFFLYQTAAVYGELSQFLGDQFVDFAGIGGVHSIYLVSHLFASPSRGTSGTFGRYASIVAATDAGGSTGGCSRTPKCGGIGLYHSIAIVAVTVQVAAIATAR